MGARKRRTKRMIEAAGRPATGQAFLRDSDVVGLALRLTPGSRSWVFAARMRGRYRRMTLGSYPALSVEAARRTARATGRGRCRRQPSRSAQGKIERTVPTFGELSCEYIAVHAKVHKQTWRSDERMLKRHFASWSARRLDDVTQWSLHKHIRERSGPYEANRVHALVRHMLNMAIRWRWITGANPAAGIPRFKEIARERVLSPNEVCRVWAAVAEEPNPWWQAFFRLSIFLGTRSGELLAVRWEDADLEALTIRFPKTKAGWSRTLPLVDDAAQVLLAIPRLEGNPHVVPGKGGLRTPRRAGLRVGSNPRARLASRTSASTICAGRSGAAQRISARLDASFGWPAFPDDALNATVLLQIADGRMYAVKRPRKHARGPS